MSENVKIVPLNPEGALELGILPCKYCDAGWGVYSKTKVDKCAETCTYLQRFTMSTELKKSCINSTGTGG